MADTLPAITPEESHIKQETSQQRRFPAWHHLALAGITLVSIFMNFFQLGAGGYGSYYPPAVRSMMDNWHNFFFASYDPGGFVTVDKPPVGFWLDVLSAKIFGFNSVSILIPQALCGVLAVLLLYYLVRRHFGVVAGLIAALALAVSPISIVTNRNITIDSILALVLLAGAWTTLRAAETGKLRWLLLTALIVGIGFNIKMMEAYLVLPAFGVLYLVAAPHGIWKRVGHLALAALLLLVVSFSWIAVVDSIPASQRPYVDSTTDNSELTLALGYNGVQRLLGGFGGLFRGGGRGAGRGGFGGGGGFPNGTPPRTTGTGSTNTGATPPNGAAPGGSSSGGTTNSNTNNARNAVIQRALQNGGPGGGLFAIGTAGPLRLFLEPLAGQIAWILPLALLGLLALLWQRRLRLQEDRQQQSMVLWGMWVLTMGAFFSVAGFFHPYYMTEMAPGIAALVGIGVVMMWQDYRRNGWRGWLLPLALAITIVEQVYILSAYPAWGRWMIPLLVVLGVLGVGTLVVARLLPRLNLSELYKDRLLMTSVGIGVLALLIGPAVWGAIPVLAHTQGDVLSAGPQSGGDFGGFGGRAANSNANTKLINYLEANQGNAKFLVAVPSSQGIADQLIIATNKPVMSLGGFSGSDPILTTSQLAALVKNGTVRFFLINGTGNGQGQTTSTNSRQTTDSSTQRTTTGAGGFGGFGQQSTLTTWVTQNCKTVPSNLWQSSSSTNTGTGGFGGGGFGGAQQLYDCASAQ